MKLRLETAGRVGLLMRLSLQLPAKEIEAKEIEAKTGGAKRLVKRQWNQRETLFDSIRP